MSQRKSMTKQHGIQQCEGGNMAMNKAILMTHQRRITNKM